MGYYLNFVYTIFYLFSYHPRCIVHTCLVYIIHILYWRHKEQDRIYHFYSYGIYVIQLLQLLIQLKMLQNFQSDAHCVVHYYYYYPHYES